MLRFLFSFKGRVNRAKFWAFYLASSLCFGAALFVLIALEQTMSPAPPFGLFDLQQPHTLGEWVSGLAVAAIYLFFAYLIIAMVAKRLHDRNKSAWWLAFFYGVPVAFFATAISLGWPALNHFPGESIIMGVFFFVAWLTGAWYLIEILFLPGTDGDNRFGPDPRGRKLSDLANI